MKRGERRLATAASVRGLGVPDLAWRPPFVSAAVVTGRLGSRLLRDDVIAAAQHLTVLAKL